MRARDTPAVACLRTGDPSITDPVANRRGRRLRNWRPSPPSLSLYGVRSRARRHLHQHRPVVRVCLPVAKARKRRCSQCLECQCTTSLLGTGADDHRHPLIRDAGRPTPGLAGLGWHLARVGLLLPWSRLINVLSVMSEQIAYIKQRHFWQVDSALQLLPAVVSAPTRTSRYLGIPCLSGCRCIHTQFRAAPGVPVVARLLGSVIPRLHFASLGMFRLGRAPPRWGIPSLLVCHAMPCHAICPSLLFQYPQTGNLGLVRLGRPR